MPFDPKLVPLDEAPEDHDGDVALSDELSELAAQLRSESELLAERFASDSRSSWLDDQPVPADRTYSLELAKPTIQNGAWTLILLGLSLGVLLCTGVYWATNGWWDSNTDRDVAGIRNDDREATALTSEHDSSRIGSIADHVASRFQIRELMATDPTTTLDPDMTKDEQIELLEEALDRYQNVIVFLQDQLSSREKEKLRTEALIESLHAEIALLKKQRGEHESITASEND